MPTYLVSTTNVKLNQKAKNKLAKKITEIHNTATGANKYFAQIIFKNVKKGDHYMGGKLVKNKEIFIYGHIRSGRTSRVKNKLITGIRDLILKNIKIKKDNIWIYILDLIPGQMIEYGEILPLSGGEKKWFKNLPNNLKKRLNKIDD